MDTDAKKNLTVRVIKDSLVFRYMPDPADHIRHSTRGLKIFDDMIKDSRIVGLFYDRRNATQNLTIDVSDTGDAKVDKFRRDHLGEKALRKWSNTLLTDALTYGFCPTEILWTQDGPWLYPDSLITNDINRYKFNRDGDMFYMGYAGLKACDQPYKWLVHRIEGDRYNRPYGRPYMEAAYWPWQFKKMGWEFWLTATERFAVPSLVALFEQSDETKAKEIATTLVELIAQINSGSSGALGNIKDLKQIDMGGKVSDFDQLIKACDLQISYAMTAQALANSVSDTGTQALGTVQADTKEGLYQNDARALAYTMQKLIDMVIEVNFGHGAPVPQFAYDTDNWASFEELMSAIEHGVPVSKKALYTRYKLPEPEDKADEFLRSTEAAWPTLGAMGRSVIDDDDDDSHEEEPPAIEDPDSAVVAEPGAGVTLNGAQVVAATGIVKSVELGELPRDSGIGQLKILFNLTEEQAEEMMGSAGKNPRPPEVKEFADTGKKKRGILLIQ